MNGVKEWHHEQEFVINKPEGYWVIRLSQPLLKYRSVKELHETLLHEMIHAYLFMVHRLFIFRKIRTIIVISVDMERTFKNLWDLLIKQQGIISSQLFSYNLTIYHTFHNEIEWNQDHIWLWDGVCQTKKPFFGIVKR